MQRTNEYKNQKEETLFMTIISKYTHYGKPVKYAFGIELFNEFVASKDSWVLLPVKEYNFYKTTNNNVVEYIIILPHNVEFNGSCGDNLEDAIIFEDIPEDLNLTALIYDVERQVMGKIPATMPSKCKVLITDSFRNAMRKVEKGDLIKEEQDVFKMIKDEEMANENLPPSDSPEFGDYLDSLLTDRSLDRAKERMAWIIASSALKMMGYGREFFENNDTSDVNSDDLEMLYHEFDRFADWEHRVFLNAVKKMH